MRIGREQHTDRAQRWAEGSVCGWSGMGWVAASAPPATWHCSRSGTRRRLRRRWPRPSDRETSTTRGWLCGPQQPSQHLQIKGNQGRDYFRIAPAYAKQLRQRVWKMTVLDKAEELCLQSDQRESRFISHRRGVAKRKTTDTRSTGPQDASKRA